jgi:hypothetical protein
MFRRGAVASAVDRLVTVLKLLYWQWSVGGSPRLGCVNWQREEPNIQRKAAAFGRWHQPDKSRGLSADLPSARPLSCAEELLLP